MQEEVENKTVALAINVTKLTARELKTAILKYLDSQKNRTRSRDSPKIPHGKQSVKSLAKQNQGMTSIEITDQNIKSFERVARKYGVDFAVQKDKRFRKWGGIPTGITQNVKDLLSSREVENIFENSDFVYMLNQASGDRQILAKQLNISPHQLSYVTHSGEGEGLLFYGNVILPLPNSKWRSTRLSKKYQNSRRGFVNWNSRKPKSRILRL